MNNESFQCKLKGAEKPGSTLQHGVLLLSKNMFLWMSEWHDGLMVMMMMRRRYRFSQQKKISPSRGGSGRCWASGRRRRGESVSSSQETILPESGFCCNVYSLGMFSELHLPASY